LHSQQAGSSTGAASSQQVVSQQQLLFLLNSFLERASARFSSTAKTQTTATIPTVARITKFRFIMILQMLDVT
jgi:hypothetical protein